MWARVCLYTVTTCGKFGWLLLPSQHSEHKSRSKQRERDTWNPGMLLLTAVIQRNSIMCANNVINHYLEHNSVNKSASLQNTYRYTAMQCLPKQQCQLSRVHLQWAKLVVWCVTAESEWVWSKWGPVSLLLLKSITFKRSAVSKSNHKRWTISKHEHWTGWWEYSNILHWKRCIS